MRKNYIDLHTHSVLSKHAYSSLTENIEYAAKIGLKVYGISEHQPDKYGVGAHNYVFSNSPRLAPKEYGNTKILVGAELNILDGYIDTDNMNIDKLSYCIASMHDYCYPHEKHTIEDNTRNYIMALENPYVTIIGHPDSPNYPFDHEKVIMAAKKNDKLIELNNSSFAKMGTKEIDIDILNICKKYKQPIILNSDSHIKYDIGNVECCISLLEEVDFPFELVVNFNEDLFNHYFKYR